MKGQRLDRIGKVEDLGFEAQIEIVKRKVVANIASRMGGDTGGAENFFEKQKANLKEAEETRDNKHLLPVEEFPFESPD